VDSEVVTEVVAASEVAEEEVAASLLRVHLSRLWRSLKSPTHVKVKSSPCAPTRACHFWRV